MTDQQSRDERLHHLNDRRSSGSDNRRAAMGRILTAGLASTSVFGLTAALGWSGATAGQSTTSTPTEQLILDLSTGQLTRYVNGTAVSIEAVAIPQPLNTPTPVAPLSVDSIGELAVAGPTTPRVPPITRQSGMAAGGKASTEPSAVTQPPSTFSTTTAPAQFTADSSLAEPVVVTIPLPEPATFIDIGNLNGIGLTGGGGGTSGGS